MLIYVLCMPHLHRLMNAIYMNKAIQNRLEQARQWYEEQNFTEDSHIVKAYRKRFGVDNTCAKRELCMLGILSPDKQAKYEQELKAKEEKRKRKREEKQNRNTDESFRDDYFYYIAGYTSGGAPYGIPWEEAKAQGLTDEEEE